MKFTYKEYIEILKLIGPRLCFFKLQMPENFILLRHDVEFDISRAFELAKIESKHNVKSTFFFQVFSSAYNSLSPINKNMIKQIKDLGHEVGLHFYASNLITGDWSSLYREMDIQKTIFEKGLEMDCDIFSYHRPPKWFLENRDDQINGVMNAYGRSFFEFSSNPKDIKYLADSQHKWLYGHPNNSLNPQKIQILCHPDEWTKSGDKNNQEYFSQIIKDNTKNFINILDNETKHFNEHKKLFL